jgi:Mlc titration factor MtfA (ptsG expression regulator)
MPIFPAARRRRRAYEAGFLDDWLPWLERRVPRWASLSTDERTRLQQLALTLIVESSWEGTHDFPISDEVKVTIAGQAALMLLELDVHPLDLVQHIIVREFEWFDDMGPDVDTNIASRDPQEILGEVLDERSTLIVWDAVMEDLTDADGAAGVVFHEVAHKLDLLDGVINGTPLIADEDLLREWTDICTTVFELVDAGRGPDCIIDYALTDPGEFFAVVTEVFFCRPQLLHTQSRRLYDAFARYFNQDPASRV